MTQNLTRYEALQTVRSSFKNQQEMADFFDVAQATVSLWLKHSKQLPAKHVLLAERGTGVSRHALRPDIYPVEALNAPPAWHGVDRGDGRVSFQNDAILQGNHRFGAAA